MPENATITVEVLIESKLLDESGAVVLDEEGAEITTEDWLDITNDVIAPIKIRYGIWGNRPTDRMASSGACTFQLNNGENNIGSALGYYTPGHANALYDWDIGLYVRVGFTYGGTTYYKFYGSIRQISPIAGLYRDRRVKVRCVDWIADAAEWKLDLLTVQTNQRADQFIQTVIDNMTRQPRLTSLEEGQSTFSYVGDGAKDEKTTALAAIQRAVLSEFGFCYIIGDTTGGGTLAFDDRHQRVTDTTVEHTLTESELTDMQVLRHDNLLYNVVRATSYPREISAAATEILYNLPNAININPGDTEIIIGRYRDPNQVSARISGTEMVTPVASTDYEFGSSEGAGVEDLNGNLTITATYGANSVKYELTSGATVTGYLNKLQARGKAVRLFDPQIALAVNSTSRVDYGDRPLDMNLLFQDDPLEAQDFSDITRTNFKDPATRVALCELWANKSATCMNAALQGEPGDRVQIDESMTAINDEYFIDGVEINVVDKNNFRCRWNVRIAGESNYWLLGQAGASELGQTTILGF
jgi:hypothetical protein